jgi:UDP-N-acetylglucosamine--N-acetylmuramyl-(pentapeptide) pyrophosphoryl-undecaprenol N-acetylglucosamine transferase
MTGRVLIAAGGTGGHIFPGIALAQAFKEKGWAVHWIGSTGGMEESLVRQEYIPFFGVSFKGLRGKGIQHALQGSFNLLRSGVQALHFVRQWRPSLVVGFGGYPSVPGVWAGHVLGVPIVIHESNRIMGLANRWVARWASQVGISFEDTDLNGKGSTPRSLEGKVHYTGAPLRKSFAEIEAPSLRYAQRTGALRLVVVGGSQGATTLNALVPEALSLIPTEHRPQVIHQSGQKNLEGLKALYARYQVKAECLSFIEDMPRVYAEADVVICRAGALTIAELLAMGVPGLYIPLPFAADQPLNAQWCEDHHVGWCRPQSTLTAQKLAEDIQKWTREGLAAQAELAYKQGVRDGTARLLDLCERAAQKK